MARVAATIGHYRHIAGAMADQTATLTAECAGVLAARLQCTVDDEVLDDTRPAQVVKQA